MKQDMHMNIPRKVRIYDNGGETFDRYTVVFTGRYGHLTAGETWILGMSGNPCHPQGFGQHSTYRERIDVPSYAHLGKRISFLTLPRPCQDLVRADYRELWGL